MAEDRWSLGVEPGLRLERRGDAQQESLLKMIADDLQPDGQLLRREAARHHDRGQGGVAERDRELSPAAEILGGGLEQRRYGRQGRRQQRVDLLESGLDLSDEERPLLQSLLVVRAGHLRTDLDVVLHDGAIEFLRVRRVSVALAQDLVEFVEQDAVEQLGVVEAAFERLDPDLPDLRTHAREGLGRLAHGSGDRRVDVAIGVVFDDAEPQPAHPPSSSVV
jgi:hypothetical protein